MPEFVLAIDPLPISCKVQRLLQVNALLGTMLLIGDQDSHRLHSRLKLYRSDHWLLFVYTFSFIIALMLCRLARSAFKLSI